MKSGHDSLAVLRMDVIVPPLNLRKDLVLAVAKNVFDGIVPDEGVRFDIPIPDDIVRSSGDESKTLVGGSHCPLGLPLVGYVDHDRDRRDHGSSSILDRC